ncbi:MAG: MFS transporter, partial [Candidatus Eremiobacteraeota bacterium]|nr:MFS transporter [Candidatus Eremiobacteraeota bacterium]
AIFGLAGPFPGLLVNAVTYIAASASLGAIRDRGPEQTSGIPHPRHVIDDVVLGFRFLFGDRAMTLVTFGSFIANFFGSFGFTAYVPFIKRDLGGSDLSVGIVFGAMGAGTVLGALLVSRIHISFGKNMTIGYAWSFVNLALIWTRDVTTMAVVLGVLSIAAGWNVSATLGWRMRIIPEETVGRVFGAARLLVLGGTLPGALLGGALADAYGARTAIAVSAIGISILIVFVLTNRTIREESR